jgi:hypothetical protein
MKGNAMGENDRILSVEGMERFYGDFFQRGAKKRLSPSAIPKQFWPLIPYAEFWGVSDDIERDILVDEAPVEVQRNLRDAVMPFDNAFDEWLAGPEAHGPAFSREYVAYSDMRMAAHYAAGIIRNEEENYRFVRSNEMKAVYGDFYQRSPRVPLDREAIPYGCQPLTHYAEFWGLPDDQARNALVEQAPPGIRQNLKQVVRRFTGDLNEWRDGRDPDHPPSGPEYNAFLAMIKAADSA